MRERFLNAKTGMFPVVVAGVTAPAPAADVAILTASLAWLLVPLVVLALAAAALVIYSRFVHADEVEPGDDLPPLVFPVTARTPFIPARDRLPGALTGGAARQAARPDHSRPDPAQPDPAQPDPAQPRPAHPEAKAPAATAVKRTGRKAGAGTGRKAGAAIGNSGGTVPTRGGSLPSGWNGPASGVAGSPGADVTLQLLPGRLEVLDGEAGAQEIRFVRPAVGDPVVTLGRAPGDGPAHVRLQNPTVSRAHARLRFDDGEWSIVNLSSTNPALLNGEALPVDDGERTLRDGDRLELGQVVLRYRRR
jgi:hypothetical protein